MTHAVQHTAMRGLQPVADVRQRSADDHAHRVIHVRALHLVFDVDGDFCAANSMVSGRVGSGIRDQVQRVTKVTLA